jgi:hypothetical protein
MRNRNHRNYRHHRAGTRVLAPENFVVPSGRFRGLTLGEVLDRLALASVSSPADICRVLLTASEPDRVGTRAPLFRSAVVTAAGRS